MSVSFKGSTENKSSMRGSIFTRARMSFFRSKGERGADVLTLRGKTGANFEGKVRVTRGSEGCFSCFGNIGSSEQDKERYVLIKGSNLFVFLKEDSAAPKYAVDLARKVVNVHPASGQCQMVCLETALGDTEYQFKFDLKENPESANDFAKALKEQIHVADAEAAKAVRSTMSTYKLFDYHIVKYLKNDISIFNSFLICLFL